MLKHLMACGALLALGAAPVAAQQQEAVLQRMHVPGAVFDIVFAIPKSPPPMLDNLNMSPEALIMHLTGGQLAVAFEDAREMLKVADTLRSSASSSNRVSDGGKGRTPLAVYIVPKSNRSSADQLRARHGCRQTVANEGSISFGSSPRDDRLIATPALHSGHRNKSTKFSSTAVITSYSCRDCCDVEDARHVSRAGVSRFSNELEAYSITSAACASTGAGIFKPIAFAALRLMTRSKLVGSWIGSSPGLAPLSILST